MEYEQVVEQLRTLRAQIPEFVQPNHRALERMKRLASVNVELAREAVNAVDASEVVQSAIGNTPAEGAGAAAEGGVGEKIVTTGCAEARPVPHQEVQSASHERETVNHRDHREPAGVAATKRRAWL